MLASSVLSNVLTSDEQELIPEFVMRKLHSEMSLYEEGVSKRMVELERRIGMDEERAGEMSKTIVMQEMRLKEAARSLTEASKQNEGYVREISSLREEMCRYRERVEVLERKRGERDGEFSGSEGCKEKMACDVDSLRERVGSLERENGRLVKKMVDQKNQIGYLVKKSQNAPETRNNLELVRLVQRLSKRNDELERKQGDSEESVCDEGGVYSRLVERIMAEREEYRRAEKELVEVRRSGYALELEYNRVFKERAEMYSQLQAYQEEKKEVQRYVEEMKEELVCVKMELQNSKMKNMLLGEATQKLREMNDEIVQNKVVMRENRNKISELKMQLAESEERYNRYVLEDRTNVTALLGREVDGIKKRLDRDVGAVYDIEMRLKGAVEEQKKLKRLQGKYVEAMGEQERTNKVLREKEKRMGREMDEYRDRVRRCRSVLVEIGGEMGGVLCEIRGVCDGLMGVCDVFNRVVEFERERRIRMEGLYSETCRMSEELLEKDRTLYSVIENRPEDAVGLLGKERNILKQENIFLRHKMESLGDSGDLAEKVNVLEEENLRIRGQLERRVDETSRENEELKRVVEVLRGDLSGCHDAINKYRTVVEKLRKIKDAYVKLRGECSGGTAGGLLEEKGPVDPSVQETEAQNIDNGVVEPKEVRENEDGAERPVQTGDRAGQSRGGSQGVDSSRDQVHGRGRRSERPRQTGEDGKPSGYRRPPGERRGWSGYDPRRNKERRG